MGGASIRHTCASLLLSDVASLVYVKEQLGHSSIEVTVDIVRRKEWRLSQPTGLQVSLGSTLHRATG